MKPGSPRPNPYIGPRSFQTGETLYGRDREQRDLLNFLLSQRVILLYSPSGAGKTSLIHAGLIPNLKDRGFSIPPVIRLNLDPGEAGAESPSFNRYVYSAMLSLEEGLPEDQQTSYDNLARLSLEDYLDQRPRQDRDSEQLDIEVLIFDQFEEILTVDPTDSAGRGAFFDQLGNALRQRNRWALFSLREDYIAALDPYQRTIPTHFNNRYRLDLLGVEAARMAIQRPASQMEVDFTDTAAQKLVDDLRRVQVQRPDGFMEEQLGGYVEPVQLQVVCFRLWGNLRADQNQISVEDIARTGDVNQSLGGYYADRIAAIANETGLRERLIRGWFENRLITEGGIRSQVLMGSEQSGELDNRAIRLLEDAHLVRAEKRRGATWFELAHDRLIEPVRRDNATWFQAKLSPLQRQAELWERENRPSHLLLREAALQEAQDWAEKHPDELTSAEIEFLNDSQEANQREIEAQEAQQRQLEMAQQLAEEQEKRAKEQARSARRLRWLAVGLGAVVIAAIALAFLATSAQRTASNQAATATNALGQAEVQAAAATHALGESYIQGTEIAELRDNAVEAKADLARSALTALAAESLAESERITAEAASTEAIIQAQRAEERAQAAQQALSSQLAAQGELLLQDNNIRLAALLGVEAFRTFDTATARSLLLNSSERLQQFKITTEIIPESQQNKITSLAVHPDGDQFAYGLRNGMVVNWNVSSKSRGVVLEENYKEATALAFSKNPDTLFLAVGETDGWVRLYNSKTNETDSFKMDIPTPIADLDFHPTENWLAVPAENGVFVYDIDEIWGWGGPNPRPHTRNYFPNEGNVTSIAWSKSGDYLLVGDDRNSVQVWRHDQENRPIVGPFTEHLGAVSSVAWSPDGEQFASSSINDFSDTQIVVRNFPSGEIEENFKLQDRGVEAKSLSFNPDGRILAVGNYEGKVFFWDTNDWSKIGEVLVEYEGPDSLNNNNIQKVSFLPRPGQNLLAAAQLGGNIGLINVNLQQGLMKDIAKDLGGEVLALYAFHDGSLQAAIQRERGVQVIRIDPDGIQTALAAINQPTTSAVFSPEGATLVLGDEEFAHATIYNAETGSQVEQVIFLDIPEDRGQVVNLSYSQDGNYLAGSLCLGAMTGSRECDSDSLIRVLPVGGSSAPDYTLNAPHSFAPFPLAFAPGEMILTSGSGAMLLIWDIVNGTYDELSELSTGFTDSFSFNPEESVLAIGDSNARLQLMDTSTGQFLGPPLTGSPARFTSLAFNQAGDKLYAGLENGTIQVWEMAPDVWTDIACAIAGQPLSEQEWHEYLPDQEYKPHCKGSDGS